MRLTSLYVQNFKNYLNSLINSEYELYLFGSRVIDTKKGGDINLLVVIESPEIVSQLKSMSAAIKVKLCDLAGDQRVDVVFCNKNDVTSNEFLKTISKKVLL